MRYNNTAPFIKLPNGPTQGLATGDLDGDGRDELLADLGSRGFWAYYNNAAPWKKLDPTSLVPPPISTATARTTWWAPSGTLACSPATTTRAPSCGFARVPRKRSLPAGSIDPD